MQKVEKEQKEVKPNLYYETYSLLDAFPLTSDLDFVVEDKRTIKLHYHNILEIGYCYEGNGIFAVGNKILPYQSGDMSIITSKEAHIAKSRKGTKSIWTFMFLDLNGLISLPFPEWASFDVTAYSGPKFNNILSHDKYPEICSIVHSIADEEKAKKKHYQVIIKSLLMQFTAHLSRLKIKNNLYYDQFNPQTIERIKPAIDYLFLNHREKIRIKELANMCFMSQRNFTRLFKKIINKSPQQYILEMRFVMACNHLRNTDDPIGMIALDTGFPTISSFNRIFKSEKGFSPRAWRKSMK